MKFSHTFFSTEEALGEYFKDTWVRVNPSSPMPFMSNIKMNNTNRVIVTMV